MKFAVKTLPDARLFGTAFRATILARMASTRALCSAVKSDSRGLRICSVAMTSISALGDGVGRDWPDDDQLWVVFKLEHNRDVFAV